MAMSTEWKETARELNELIDPIAKKILREWEREFIEVKLMGLEPRFDRVLIEKIKEKEEVYKKFMEFMRLVVENYGKIWYEFSEEEKEIITLKESKIF